MQLGYVNGVLWGMGNALTTSTLVSYLALELGAKGMAFSWILASPMLVGLLRLASPVLMHLLGSARRTCLAFSLASYTLLWGLPALALGNSLLPPNQALWLMIGLVCLHQLWEYVAHVAFWSWMADLVPRRIRGRYFARRQMWQLAFLIPVLVGSAWFTDQWKEHFRDQPQWKLAGYAITTGLGTLLLCLSIIPLKYMPTTRVKREAELAPLWHSIGKPFHDGNFLWLVLFGCWFSLANGVTQSAQGIYPYRVLALGVLPLTVMQSSMRLGQLGLSFWVGPFSDRFGNRPVLIVSQLIVATGPLFYFFADKDHPLVIAGAWLVWSAYVGLNVCLPNVMLKLAPAGENASYIAAYFGLTNLVYAVSTVAGGYFLEKCQQANRQWEVGNLTLDYWAMFFLAGFALRVTAVPVLLALREPGALRWRDLFRQRAKVAPAETQPTTSDP